MQPGFLLALLGENITIIELLESESNIENKELKYNRVDLVAKDSKGDHIIIEVQYSTDKNYFKRLLYGTSKDITDNIKSGEDYGNVVKVYSISLIYFNIPSLSVNKKYNDYVYHGKIKFTGLHHPKAANIDSNSFAGYDINSGSDINIFPEYFIISMNIFDNQVKDSLDEWIYSFKNHEVKDEFKARGIKEMSDKLDYVSMDREKQILYDKYLVDLASDRGALEFAKEQGIEQGIEKERTRSEQEKKNIVINLFHEGSELPFISKVTGLSLEQIKNILKS
jgi:hypothetical protein